MAATTQLITVEEFSKLSDDKGSVYHELRHGEVVAVSHPKIEHQEIQRRLVILLNPLAPGGYVWVEVPFRALPEYELRVADVAYVEPGRWARADRKGYLHGAPEMVIEVLSPSNSVAEMDERKRLCLENGSLEFWVVDPDHRTVQITTRDGQTVTWQVGQQIRLNLFAGATIAVAAMFE